MVGQKNYTYREFIFFILDNIASAAASVNATQIDIVIDFYHAMSIKAGTRVKTRERIIVESSVFPR